MNATFGIPGVKEHCFFLKSMQDAQELRRHVRWAGWLAVAAPGQRTSWELLTWCPPSVHLHPACPPLTIDHAQLTATARLLPGGSDAAKRWSTPPCRASLLRSAARCCPLWWWVQPAFDAGGTAATAAVSQAVLASPTLPLPPQGVPLPVCCANGLPAELLVAELRRWVVAPLAWRLPPS